ncbi:MAG TPA: hypothetical protein VH164_01160 [Ktedonobacteraceae bacterium]|nr:hypothetical protein [Ktedonobacteraceae bacterium]
MSAQRCSGPQAVTQQQAVVDLHLPQSRLQTGSVEDRQQLVERHIHHIGSHMVMTTRLSYRRKPTAFIACRSMFADHLE